MDYTLFDEEYGEYFGFTEEEVKDLLPPNTSIEPIQNWYNGYEVGGYRIYNPWSIMMYLKKKKLGHYWDNTSDDALVHKLIKEADLDLKENFENLIRNGELEIEVDSSLTFPYAKDSEKAIWTLLFHAGYLTLKTKIDEDGETFQTMRVPNKEVMFVYEKMVKNWFESVSLGSYKKFIRSLEKGKVEEFFGFIKTYILCSSSCFDFGKKTSEQVFHVFMLGLLVGFKDTYDVSSNKESGKGRHDIVLKPKTSGKKGIILEFKACKEEEDLDQLSLEAIIQIKKKCYAYAFEEGTKILCIGLAFCGKEVRGKHEEITHYS
jgi:hypothetical protein